MLFSKVDFMFALSNTYNMSAQIKSFDKNSFATLRPAINQALAKVAAEFGLTSLEMGNVTFSGGEFKSSLIGKIEGVSDPRMDAYNLDYSKSLGYDVNIVGMRFSSNGKTFIVSKIEVNRPKYPVIATCEQDKRSYKFTHNAALTFIGENKPTYTHEKNLFAMPVFSGK